MRDYELTVLFKASLGEKELGKEVKDLTALLLKANAEIKSKTDAVKRPLSYEVGKNREAYFVYLELQLEPAEVGNLEEKLKLEDNLIRYLLVQA